MLRFANTCLAAILAACVLTAPAEAAKDDLLLVSAPLVAPFALDAGSELPAVSENGRYVAFQTASTNLVAGGTNGKTHVYVKDLATGEVDLISRSETGVQGDSNSSGPSISADGRYVAFSSSADNLVPGVVSEGMYGGHVFVRDRQENKIIAVDRSVGGVLGVGSANNASISADGKKVAFLSVSTNLTPGVDGPGLVDAFVKDLEGNGVVLLSRGNGPSGVASNGTTSWVDISADGKYAAFVSVADNLGVGNDLKKVFLRGTVNDSTLSLVSRAAGTNGAAADADADKPSVSADGDVVAFQSEATNLSSLDTAGTIDVFARKMSATTVNLISRGDGSQGVAGDDSSFTPSISADGNRVAFATYADNISTVDADNGINIHVRNRADGTTTYVSREPGVDGAFGEENSDQPDISGDGRWVAFRGQGDNLSAVDSDTYADIFSRDVLGGDPFIDPTDPGDPSDPGNPTDPGNPNDPTDPGTPGGPPGPEPVKLLAFKASPKRFVARKGTTVAVKVSGASRVRLVLRRRASNAGKVRWIKVGTMTRTTEARLRVKVAKRFAGKRIQPGRYRLIAVVVDPVNGTKISSPPLKLRVIR